MISSHLACWPYWLKRRTSIAEVRVRIPEGLNFFSLSFCYCIGCVSNYDNLLGICLNGLLYLLRFLPNEPMFFTFLSAN